MPFSAEGIAFGQCRGELCQPSVRARGGKIWAALMYDAFQGFWPPLLVVRIPSAERRPRRPATSHPRGVNLPCLCPQGPPAVPGVLPCPCPSGSSSWPALSHQVRYHRKTCCLLPCRHSPVPCRGWLPGFAPGWVGVGALMPWSCQEPCVMPEGWAGQALGTLRLVLALLQTTAQQMLWGDFLAHVAPLPRGSSAHAPDGQARGAHGQGCGWAPGWGGHGVAGGQPGHDRMDKEPERGVRKQAFGGPGGQIFLFY